MNLRRVDLNLLGVFHAIYETRSVTLAAERFGITQPAMSNALARLRELCGDPLFVPTSNGMQPTPYALEIADTIAEALRDVQAVLGHRRTFDPAVDERLFRLHLNDTGQIFFLPPLLARLQQVAPAVRVEATTLPIDAIRDALAEGEIDFALGKLPKLGGRGVRSKVLFGERYEVLRRAGRGRDGERLTREAFLAARHAVVSSASGGHRVIEETLIKLRARIVLRVPNFTVIPTILQHADLLVIVPSRLARELARSHGLVAHPLPIEIPSFDVAMYWHERFHADPAIAWMRQQLLELYAEHERSAAGAVPESRSMSRGVDVL
ncbi:MAG TPA: LysR family transcriptional regulator [Burkholderiales bacterium]